MAATHEFPADQVHYTWDIGREPLLTIASGETVGFTTREVSDNQVTPESDASALADLDWTRIYPLAGPVAVHDAQPGDTLVVEILDLQTQGWGWSAIVPELNLLASEFPEAYLRTFDLSGGEYAYVREDVAVPLAPFLGTMGVCPAGAREVPHMPPGLFGGNIDVRQLIAGTTLYLPVEVEGALFSCGDGHAAQGDGEFAATGLEAPMTATLRFSLAKGRSIPSPQFRASGPLTPRVDRGHYFATTGIGKDLYVATQDAVRAMIDHVTAGSGLSREDAFLLTTMCVDVKVSSIIGTYVVSAVLPEAVFADGAPAAPSA
jgi:acetamidase/formamidase